MKFETLAKLADSDASCAAFAMGLRAEQNGEKKIAETWYRQAAQSCPVAGLALAILLIFDGSRMLTAGDRFDEAKQYAEIASEARLGPATWLVGSIRELALNDYDGAMSLYKSALEQGYKEALTDIGRLHANKDCGHYNQQKAETMLTEALDRKDFRATMPLSMLLAATSREDLAKKTLELGVTAKDRSAILWKAMLLRYGRGGYQRDVSGAIRLEELGEQLVNLPPI
jgi:tetratricopeptide (TPR) repeat protein